MDVVGKRKTLLRAGSETGKESKRPERAAGPSWGWRRFCIIEARQGPERGDEGAQGRTKQGTHSRAQPGQATESQEVTSRAGINSLWATGRKRRH